MGQAPRRYGQLWGEPDGLRDLRAVHVVMDDGTEIDSGAGDVAIIPPGHDAWVVGDEQYVSIDFDLGEYGQSP